ncbi:low molecular weight phosphatase family protein [Caulobacter sp. S45]|jgi:protein-tyrosine-phosphatase|uniref:arsenate-mycothiol transferase ArsC n=1 Tax=Caulobacter sp. S45 TaxID=1641861 RepID=UPI00131DF483|nr:low molecular weight phosphatase family protein [Caulobacter sp. S45]
MAAIPDAILFACNLNRVRSPVAAALLRRRFGDRIFIDSCGLRPDELEVDPFAAAVMAEWGDDISSHRAKGFQELEDGSFDLVISLTPEAHHRAAEMARARSVDFEYWATPDPTLETGSRDQRLEAYRRMRDELDRKLRARFPSPTTFGG